MKMKKISGILLLIALTSCLCVNAQERIEQNRPYIDLRKLHYGFLFGLHMQDMELDNVGPQTVTLNDGTQGQKTIVTDVDNWNPGFTVGVLGEMKLNTYLALRIVPSMHFGVKHITFRNLSETTESGNPVEVTQNLKTTYFSVPIDLKYSAERFNNYRPYFIAGVNQLFNLNGKDQDYLQLKKTDTMIEIGLGCDFYLQYFKFIPEIKFCYSLGNSLDNNHAAKLTDQSKKLYTQSVSNAHSKMIVLTFYFE